MALKQWQSIVSVGVGAFIGTIVPLTAEYVRFRLNRRTAEAKVNQGVLDQFLKLVVVCDSLGPEKGKSQLVQSSALLMIAKMGIQHVILTEIAIYVVQSKVVFRERLGRETNFARQLNKRLNTTLMLPKAK